MSWMQQIRQRLNGTRDRVHDEEKTSPFTTGSDAFDRDLDLDLDVEGDQKLFVATQWQLMWWRFRKHKLALISLVVVVLFYLVAIFAEFVATVDPETINPVLTYAPPQRIHVIGPDGLTWPFVYGYQSELDQVSLRRTFTIDPDVRHELSFFVPGAPYELWGVFETNIHLFGIRGSDEPVFLLGSDRLGRDLFSRAVYGTRVSLSIGFVGVMLSLVLGIALGGISGYYGGAIDNVIQRVIEFLRSIPSIPLWMGLSAALPLTWPPLWIFFGITVILSLIGWTGVARVVRGRFLSLREEDFVMAARVSGVGERRIIFRHMVPSFTSHIIASLTLAIPGTILAETALSFLGLGVKPPINSWGVLLQEAQNIRAVATAPWLMSPALALIIVVLAFNFLGDGLRDAADPYA